MPNKKTNTERLKTDHKNTETEEHKTRHPSIQKQKTNL